MDLRELVLHPIQLVSVEIEELSVKKYKSGALDNLDTKINVSVDGQVHSEKKECGFMYLKMEITSPDEFEIHLIYKGICNINKIVSEQDYENFLKAQSIKMLWVYARETITDIMMKMDIRPIKFPTLDVLRSVEKLRDE